MKEMCEDEQTQTLLTAQDANSRRLRQSSCRSPYLEAFSFLRLVFLSPSSALSCMPWKPPGKKRWQIYVWLLQILSCRIQLKSSQTLPGKNFTTTFLDECDRIKIWIHLHSFTYDYHLRTIHNHIAQKPSNLRKGFHIISFLDDFIKYYSKGPNFARNFVHSGLLQIPCSVVSPEQLYNYLLDHEKTYGMNVIRMEPVIIDPNTEFDNEYVLVQLSNHRVIYTDNQDVKRTDDFDVSLILSYIGNSANMLTLKYFVTMTSKRQLYPLFGVEKKLGKFRTVSTSRVSLKLPVHIFINSYSSSH